MKPFEQTSMKIGSTRTFIIIQARMTSTRLPSKVMLPLCGLPVLEFMIRRLSEFKENIIIATTDNGTEEPIVELCKRVGVRYFRGSESDVLGRYVGAASYFGANGDDIIVRLTSDCPLFCIEPLKEGLDNFVNSEYDYYTNCTERSYPRGLDFEIVRYFRLKEAHKNAKTSFEREHVMTYFNTTNKESFRLGSQKMERDYSNFRLTLDEELDYLALQETMRLLGCRIDFSFDELLTVLDAHPEIAEINKIVKHKSH